MIVAGGPEVNRELAEWLADRVKHFEVASSPYISLGWQRGGRLVGVCVFDNFTHINIDAHIAIEPGGLCAAYLGELFRYPFERLNVKRLTARIAASNFKSQAFVRGLGFLIEGTVRQGLAGGEDLLIYGMLKSECRWLGVKDYGRERTAGRTDATGSNATARGDDAARGLAH